MKLSIVIPAYNEEQAIGSIIERCLAAREYIAQQAALESVEILVVSDGSTDKTVDIASGFSGVRLIVFERNRGYGAAIKKGFEESSGEILGFLDADGTCDPRFFAPLCRTLIENRADVALGSRMGPQSRMPRLRRIGNRIYAVILSVLSNRVVTDTASGMRVLRREILPRLSPLPDGLHFTPAMSARVLMDDSMTLAERPMPYEERVGESKLHLVRDGVRFLGTILEMTLVWHPTKVFLPAAAACFALMLLLAMHPIEQWLRWGRFDQDMIYRLLFCSFLGTMGASLLSSGVICDHLRRRFAARVKPPTFVATLLERVFGFRFLAAACLCGGVTSGWLVGPGVWTRLSAGYVDLHWSRVVLAGWIAFSLGQAFLTSMIVHLLRFHAARRTAVDSATPTAIGAAQSLVQETRSTAAALPWRPGAKPKVERPLPSFSSSAAL